MRRPLSLAKSTDIDRLSVLIFGAYGAGKTHLQGDFLRWASKKGKKCAFLNIMTEDGSKPITGMGLENIHAETVENVDDFEAALKEFERDKVEALAVDSLSAFNRLVLISLCGSLRYPDPKIDGERAKMIWGQLKMKTMNGVLHSRRAVPYVLWVSPYDRTEDLTGNKYLTPDLPGQQALASVGWFDFVGYLRATTTGPGKVVRDIQFSPSETIATRQRAPKMIAQKVMVPENEGGWEALYTAIEGAFA